MRAQRPRSGAQVVVQVKEHRLIDRRFNGPKHRRTRDYDSGDDY